MSYDKCGAANVAGFFKVAVTRNSCGEEGYVTDEILTARSGVRVRIGNTDAEGSISHTHTHTHPIRSFIFNYLGRLVMTDPLCYMKELALNEVNPRLFTLATLTGHAARTYGENYTVEKNF